MRLNPGFVKETVGLWSMAFIVGSVGTSVFMACSEGPTVALDADVPPASPCDSSCPPARVDTFNITRVDTFRLDNYCWIIDQNFGDPWFQCDDGYQGPRR